MPKHRRPPPAAAAPIQPGHFVPDAIHRHAGTLRSRLCVEDNQLARSAERVQRYAGNTRSWPSGDHAGRLGGLPGAKPPKNIFGGRRVVSSLWLEPSASAVTTVMPLATPSDFTNAMVRPSGDQPIADTTWRRSGRGFPPSSGTRHASASGAVPVTATTSTELPSGVTVMLAMRLNLSGGTSSTCAHRPGQGSLARAVQSGPEAVCPSTSARRSRTDRPCCRRRGSPAHVARCSTRR